MSDTLLVPCTAYHLTWDQQVTLSLHLPDHYVLPYTFQKMQDQGPGIESQGSQTLLPIGWATRHSENGKKGALLHSL